jgi:hypothetical protein
MRDLAGATAVGCHLALGIQLESGPPARSSWRTRQLANLRHSGANVLFKAIVVREVAESTCFLVEDSHEITFASRNAGYFSRLSNLEWSP